MTDIYREKEKKHIITLLHWQNTEQVNYDYIMTVLRNVDVY